MTIKKKKLYFNFFSLFLALLPFILYIFDFKKELALLLLVNSVLLLFKVREDIYLLFLCIPIIYSNYSIVIGEFLIGNLQISLNTIRATNYGLYIEVLLMLNIFTIIFTFLIKPNISKKKVQFKDNILLFIALYISVFFINLFFFDRSAGDSYFVRTNSIHGYMFLLVLFLIYFSGKSLFRKYATIFLVSLIVIQSLIYGGRLAILPNIIITLLLFYSKKMKFRSVMLVVIIGIIVLTAVGSFRSSVEVNFETVLSIFTDQYYVQDTSVYAFNSSVTHVAASEIYSTKEKLMSFIGFIISIFTGESNEFTSLGNVTLISDRLFNNLGGGIVVTHFYFWFGWIGVFLSPYIFVKVINSLNNSKKEYNRLAFTAIVSMTSSWYLYSPLQFFRILFFFMPVLYTIFYFLSRETYKLKE